MKVEFYSDGKLLSGKIISSDAGFTTMYVEDETGGYNINIANTQLVGTISVVAEEISKPARYNKIGRLECWDVIIDQEMDFLEGSILKYLWRHKEKNGVHDLKKAVEYINKMIKDYDKLYKK